MRTDLTVIIDRSGSMHTVKEDAEGGVNSLIEQQKLDPGETLFTLIQFDTEYEFVHKGVPIKDINLKYALIPRGGTALLDAIGRGIQETGDRLRRMDLAERPSLVVFIIVTDGLENSSREYNKKKIKEMIEHQTNVYKWKFTFLGTKIDAFAEASSIGISRGSTLYYGEEKTSGAILTASSTISIMKMRSAKGLETQVDYSEEERKSVV
jgi:hypothetical protein